MSRRRLAAIAALVLGIGAGILTAIMVLQGFTHSLSVLACTIVGAGAAWFGARRRGPARIAGLAVGALALAGAILLVVTEHRLVVDLAIVLGTMLAVGAARVAFAVRASLRSVPPPQHPVLFYNPASGGGKAERFHVADEARARGIEPIELRHGDDLEALVRGAVAHGADGLAMAGGDGSQAIVAAVAAEMGLPYACVPSGTRNHFALDLGVDRDDVVGALDAFVDGGERRVDLAEVNGRVFVNNVSLGLYAEAVQRAGYRDAKLRTLLETVPDALGPDAPRATLSWQGRDGREERAAAILVSNNRYRLGPVVGAGTRPRMDEGVLGVAVLEAPAGAHSPRGSAGSPVRQWASATFELASASPVPAGIDGEAATLDPPLRFRSRHGGLRVRIAPGHPGVSPSAGLPGGVWASLRSLARMAAGRADS